MILKIIDSSFHPARHIIIDCKKVGFFDTSENLIIDIEYNSNKSETLVINQNSVIYFMSADGKTFDTMRYNKKFGTDEDLVTPTNSERDWE